MDEAKKTILILEDNAALSKALEDKLTREGFKVDAARDGKAGFALIREVMPDLVLLDLLMPEMDGFQVLEKVKLDPKTKSIPILVISNTGGQDDIERLKKLGVNDFIVKANFKISEVVEYVRKLLKMSQSPEPEQSTVQGAEREILLKGPIRISD